MENNKRGLVDSSRTSNNDPHSINRKIYKIERANYSRFRIASELKNVKTVVEQKIETAPKELKDKLLEVEEIIGNVELPGAGSLKKYTLKIKKPIKELIGSIAFKITGSLIATSLIFGGYIFALSYNNLNKVLRGGAESAVALQRNVDPSLLRTEGNGRVNVLLMGRGGGNHDGPDLTDTIMIASIDPVANSITLLSIPRDLWVSVPGHGSMKINAVWENGEFAAEGRIAPGSTDPKVIESGYKLIDQTIQDITGLNIDYNALVDFQAFKDAVDSIGGVTINVPTNLYDPNMAWENHNNPLLASAGIQHFNGDQALRYSRSRETSSDFARGQRQRDLMVAIKQKAQNMDTLSNPVKISELFNSFGNNVATDMGLSDAEKLFSIIKKIDIANINSVGLTDKTSRLITTGPMNGQSIDLPLAGLYNYDNIKTFIRTLLPDPYIKKENARILVMNGTNDPSILNSTVETLKAYGYNVVGTGNTKNNNYAATSIVDLSNSAAPYSSHYLENRLNATILKNLPENIDTATTNANFVIILGNNETISSQN